MPDKTARTPFEDEPRRAETVVAIVKPAVAPTSTPAPAPADAVMITDPKGGKSTCAKTREALIAYCRAHGYAGGPDTPEKLIAYLIGYGFKVEDGVAEPAPKATLFDDAPDPRADA